MISMRFLYLCLKITLNYSMRIFYPRLRVFNGPKEFLGRTIYVSNHPASFMDPLGVAALRMPIVFFMTRSDIFNKITWPFLWACQMLPIYREHDNDDTKGKNEAVFDKCASILKYGRNLLVFGEGFTDDTFIRRLKPIKKGAVKIGFRTLEKQNWKYKIYIAAVGCNYSDPNEMRSDLLISTSEKICLNDYREEYESQPNKVITQLTRQIELMMQDQITHVEDKHNAHFHEDIMKITRKGMNPHNFDRSLSLKKRWKYSQGLAKWMNKQDFEQNEDLQKLKKQAEDYFGLLGRFKLEERFLYWKKTSGSRLNEVLKIIFLFPFAIIGAVHCGLPYFLIKRFVEKSFRRKVFWGSVKMIMAMIIFGLINMPVIWLFYYFVYPSWWLSIAYYWSIGLTGLAAYMWIRNIKYFKIKGVVSKMKTDGLMEKREALEKRINELVPESFNN